MHVETKSKYFYLLINTGASKKTRKDKYLFLNFLAGRRNKVSYYLLMNNVYEHFKLLSHTDV